VNALAFTVFKQEFGKAEVKSGSGWHKALVLSPLLLAVFHDFNQGFSAAWPAGNVLVGACCLGGLEAAFGQFRFCRHVELLSSLP